MAKSQVKKGNKLPGKDAEAGKEPVVMPISPNKISSFANSNEAGNVEQLSGEIVAQRGSQKRTFNKFVWDHLPLGKEGWQEVQATPSTNITTQQEGPSQELLDVREEYKVLTGKDASEELNVQQIMVAIAEFGDTEEVEVTQEMLDLDSKLGLNGVKLGDKIRVPKTED